MTERIDPSTIFEVTDDKGIFQLLMNIKRILIVVEHGYPIRNKPDSMNLVFFEINIRDTHKNKEAATYDYL